MSEVQDKVYGYHTFILPFTWEIPGVNQNDEYEKLKKVFDENNFWKNTDLKDRYDILSKADNVSFDDVRCFYKEYQYFFPYVRKAIYGGEDDICANYKFEATSNNGTYHIFKGDKHYKLHINAIRVRLLNTGIGLFIMECENHGIDGNSNSQTSIEALKNINDYGRRITLPFITKGFWITADKLMVDIPGIGSFEDDFGGFVTDICEKKT